MDGACMYYGASGYREEEPSVRCGTPHRQIVGRGPPSPSASIVGTAHLPAVGASAVAVAAATAFMKSGASSNRSAPKYQQPHHHLTQATVAEFYTSKEALLAAIKQRLQIAYDAHRITREEFVAVAKNTYRILTTAPTLGASADASALGSTADASAHDVFSPKWNDQFIDTALKLQLELLGVMWPPASAVASRSGSAHRGAAAAAVGVSGGNRTPHRYSSANASFIGASASPSMGGGHHRRAPSANRRSSRGTTPVGTALNSLVSSRSSSVNERHHGRGHPHHHRGEGDAHNGTPHRRHRHEHDGGTPLGKLANEGTRPPSPVENSRYDSGANEGASTAAAPQRTASHSGAGNNNVNSTAVASRSPSASGNGGAALVRRSSSRGGGYHSEQQEERLRRLRAHHQQLALEGMIHRSASRIAKAHPNAVLLVEEGRVLREMKVAEERGATCALEEGAAVDGAYANSGGHPLEALSTMLMAELVAKEGVFRARLAEAEQSQRTGLQGLCLSRLMAVLASSSGTGRQKEPMAKAKRHSPSSASCQQRRVDSATVGSLNAVAVLSDEGSDYEDDDAGGDGTATDGEEGRDASDDSDGSPPPPLSAPPSRTALVADAVGGLCSPPPKYRDVAFGHALRGGGDEEAMGGGGYDCYDGRTVGPAHTPRRGSAASSTPVGVPSRGRLTPEGLRRLYQQEGRTAAGSAAAAPPVLAFAGRARGGTPSRGGGGSRVGALPPPMEQRPPPRQRGHSSRAGGGGPARGGGSTPVAQLRSSSGAVGSALHFHSQHVSTYADPYGPPVSSVANSVARGVGTRSTNAGRQQSPRASSRSPHQSKQQRTSAAAVAALAPRPALPTTHYPTREEVVEHVRALLQPAYNGGLLPAEAFAGVVRHVSTQLAAEGIPAGYPWQDVVSMHVHEACEVIGLV